MPLNNIFALEGPDGAGKTTVTKLLVEDLKRDGRKTTTVRLPGTTPFGDAMREILLMRQDIPISTEVAALAFTAVNVSVMELALKLSEDSIVIMDRSQWSNYAYRVAEGMPLATALGYNQHLPFQLDPVHSLLLTAPLDVMTERLNKARGDKPDRFEGRGKDFQRKVYDNYGYLAQANLMTPIDANRPPEEIARALRNHVVAHSTIGQQQQVFPQE